MSTKQVSQARNQEKNGGPYTKSEQEKRRVKVYELYFEKCYPAVKIAQMLGVNRHTINADIKSWYAQMAAQIGGENVGALVLKKIEQLELQKKRLLELLDKQTNFESKITLEKLICEIDSKIAGLVSKMTGKDLRVDKYAITEEIPEDEVSKIVRYSIFDASHLYPESRSGETILQDTIRLKKCDIQYAENALNTMKKLGLELCRDHGSMNQTYDLFRFASIRGYITKEELVSHFEKRQNKEVEEEKRSDEVEKKYVQKYGEDQSKWSEGVADMMDEEISPSLNIEEKYCL